MADIIDRILDEPVLLVGLAAALLILLGAFGLGISDDQTEAILSFLTALLAFLGAIWARRQVTPTRKLDRAAAEE